MSRNTDHHRPNNATRQATALARAKVLLGATLDMLKQADEAHFVESPLEMVMHYDEADCDGSCLKDDIEDWMRSLETPPVRKAHVSTTAQP